MIAEEKFEENFYKIPQKAELKDKNMDNRRIKKKRKFKGQSRRVNI